MQTTSDTKLKHADIDYKMINFIILIVVGFVLACHNYFFFLVLMPLFSSNKVINRPTTRAVRYDNIYIYRMDEIKSLSFHIMFYHSNTISWCRKIHCFR